MAADTVFKIITDFRSGNLVALIMVLILLTYCAYCRVPEAKYLIGLVVQPVYRLLTKDVTCSNNAYCEAVTSNLRSFVAVLGSVFSVVHFGIVMLTNTTFVTILNVTWLIYFSVAIHVFMRGYMDGTVTFLEILFAGAFIYMNVCYYNFITKYKKAIASLKNEENMKYLGGTSDTKKVIETRMPLSKRAAGNKNCATNLVASSKPNDATAYIPWGDKIGAAFAWTAKIDGKLEPSMGTVKNDGPVTSNNNLPYCSNQREIMSREESDHKLKLDLEHLAENKALFNGTTKEHDRSGFNGKGNSSARPEAEVIGTSRKYTYGPVNENRKVYVQSNVNHIGQGSVFLGNVKGTMHGSVGGSANKSPLQGNVIGPKKGNVNASEKGNVHGGARKHRYLIIHGYGNDPTLQNIYGTGNVNGYGWNVNGTNPGVNIYDSGEGSGYGTINGMYKPTIGSVCGPGQEYGYGATIGSVYKPNMETVYGTGSGNVYGAFQGDTYGLDMGNVYGSNIGNIYGIHNRNGAVQENAYGPDYSLYNFPAPPPGYYETATGANYAPPNANKYILSSDGVIPFGAQNYASKQAPVNVNSASFLK